MRKEELGEVAKLNYVDSLTSGPELAEWAVP